jgi:hypothetical protein
VPNINIENISDLDLNGNSLFEDSEGFMTELSEDNELEAIYGGLRPTDCLKTIHCKPPSCIQTCRFTNYV